jgi:hypothetical protein
MPFHNLGHVVVGPDPGLLEGRTETLLHLNRHNNNENWNTSGINSTGFWFRWLLWNLPTISSSYQDLEKDFINN